MRFSHTEKLERPPIGSVKIKDGFWTPYLDLIRQKTVPYVFSKFEEIGYLNNFALVAGTGTGESQGPYFADGLLLETIRGASDLLHSKYDPKLDELLQRLISVICAASEKSPDGFLCTSTMLRCPDKRYGLNGGDIVIQHDIYDQGALAEAAISYYLATGRTDLLKAAVRSANRVSKDAPELKVIPGHSLAEEAYVKLYQLFTEHRELDAFAAENDVHPEDYLRCAEFWYDSRGRRKESSHPKLGAMDYHQNHLPFAEQREALGHCVRAGLCYTGAAAVSRVAGREDYLPALDAIWESVTKRKMHISGGIGTRHDIEGFDVDYNLPNDAYLETCAAIALAFFAAEMALLEPTSERFDVFERALYNNILAAISEDGVHYFYQNPLISDGSIRRWEWHGCPCCPPMLIKIYGALESFIYALGQDSLFVNLYIGSEYASDSLSISQTDKIIRLDSKGSSLKVYLRIPEYAENFALKLNGEEVKYERADGYALIEGVFDGAELAVCFDEPVRRICAAPEVEADRGCVAVTRGPWLLCAEEVDNPAGVDFMVAKSPKLRPNGNGAEGLRADGGQFKLIPYYRWCNRENSGRMQVWFKQEDMKDQSGLKGELYYNYENIE